jgi:hypothetical protein
MINFRYHIISITAVFLALGLGLALGTSFGNRALVDSLQNRQGALDKEVKEKRSTNSRLESEANQAAERAKKFEEQAVAGPLIKGQLDTVPVLMVAPTGIDDESLASLRTAVTTSGADFAGTLRLDSRLDLDGDNATKLAAILGVPETTSRAELRKELTKQLADVLRAGAKAPTDTPTTEPPTTLPGATTTTLPGAPPAPTTEAPTEPSSTAEPPLITALRDGGFLHLEPPDNGESSDPLVLGGNYRYIFVTGPGADVADSDLLLPLVQDLGATAGVPLLVATAAVPPDPEANRTVALKPIRDDAALTKNVSTVDDLESFDGVAAAILGVQELGDGRHGQYGWGEGATSPLPPVPAKP